MKNLTAIIKICKYRKIIIRKKYETKNKHRTTILKFETKKISIEQHFVFSLYRSFTPNFITNSFTPIHKFILKIS